MKKKKPFAYHAIFLAICFSVFYFLWIAPPETTVLLPLDNDHERFMTMKKKEAEKFCGECHDENKNNPLPKDHPPKYRCLLCHKRVQEVKK